MEAEGRVSHAATIDPGSRDGPPTVALALATRLSGRVVDLQSVPVAGIDIRIGSEFRTAAHEEWIVPPASAFPVAGSLAANSTPGIPTVNATARTDAGGEFGFASLPEGVPLTVAFYRGGERLHILDEPLLLSRGHETREWTLVEATSLAGRVQDQNGVPVSGAIVALEGRHVGTLGREGLRGSFRIGTTKSDPRGRFEFERIPSGQWVLGLAALQPGELGQHVVAQPTLVHHPRAGAEDHVLVAHRNLFVHGRVLSVGGKPLSNIDVQLSGDGVRRGGKSRGDAGVFRLGPLPAGEFEIFASHRELGATKRHRVLAGDSDIELRLRSPGDIRGTVALHPSRMRMHVELIPHDEREPKRITSTDNKGRFRKVTVEPGVWNVYAHADGWFAARRDVRVPAAGETVTLELTALRGAELFLAVRGLGKRFRYSIVQDGATYLLNQAISSGERDRVTVPFGSIEILLSDERGTLVERRRLTLAPGDRKEVVFKMGR